MLKRSMPTLLGGRTMAGLERSWLAVEGEGDGLDLGGLWISEELVKGRKCVIWLI